MPGELSLKTWRKRLQLCGHRIPEPEWQIELGLTLWPDADTIITVAVEPDATLYPQYRNRYFLCALDPEQVFRRIGCPEPHRSRWVELVSRQPPSYWRDFMGGPGSWLLCRLARFRQVIAWSERGLPWTGLDDPAHWHEGMEVPGEAAPFFTPTGGPELPHPHVLPVADERFADTVAACLLFASVDNRDCYLADADAAEVYLAHHHEKVVVSIPNDRTREQLLQELADANSLFTDVSGFVVSMVNDENPEEKGDTPDDD